MILREKYTLCREEAIENDSSYAPGTYVIMLSGRNAATATPPKILRWLHVLLFNLQETDIVSLYREKEVGKWLLKLTMSAVSKYAEQLDNLVKDMPDKEVSMVIVLIAKGRIKGYIKWVPFTFRQKCLEKIVKKITGDNQTVITRDQLRNIWFFQFTPGPKEIPHYLDLEVAGENKTQLAVVYLPGRKTACLMCGEDTHWESK
jgi:hypothetical protein